MRPFEIGLEVLETLGRHRFRTTATALSVAWGIFVLVVLLAAGNGLENSVRWEFRDDATNGIWVYRGWTSKPWEGLGVGRRIRFTLADVEAIRAELPGIEALSARFYPWGSQRLRVGERTGSYDMRAVHPDHQDIELTKMVEGRFINDRDLLERRKVAVLGREIVRTLLPDGPSPVGTWVEVDGIAYQVVGVFMDEGGGREEEIVYLPITTAQAAYGAGDQVDQILFTLADPDPVLAEQATLTVREILARRQRFDPEDTRAVRVRNNIESMVPYNTVTGAISAFIWLVGLGTVGAGVVGVGNIMLVSVAERTREFGLRKAVGAPPRAIVGQVLGEALTLTATAGYAGLVLGVALVEVFREDLAENEYVRDPRVDVEIALAATAVLVVAGLLAGLFPARRAALVPPVEALRDE